MIPAVPFVLRGALGMAALLMALVFGVIADALDSLAHWLVPKVGAKPLEKRRREP